MFGHSQQEKLKKELCNILIRTGALKFGIFTLPDGELSPYYVDLRVIPSFPGAFARVVKLYLEIVTNDLNLREVKRIAGIPTAGIPFASVLAFSLKKPFLYIRRDTARGRQRRVEGILNPGDSVLLVDDLIATGKTMLSAVNVIRAEGGIVADALVLIDRQEGDKAVIEDQGIKLHHLVRMNEVAKILYAAGAIDTEQLDDILQQCKR